MKAVLALAVFACVAAMVAADYGHGPELTRVYGGVSALYNNAARQIHVNHRAEYKGASSGTGRVEGVPGSGNNFGYGYRGYGYRGYGYDGYYGYY